MSNVTLARRLLRDAQDLHEQASELIQRAMELMRRERPIRRARAKMVPITEGMRREVFRLARTKPDMTTQEIAIAVGLRSGGRVSEILNEKR